MGRGKFKKITIGDYSKCFLCDYEIKNNKIAMRLHFQKSHSNQEWINGKKDRLRCAVCKKENCLFH